MQQNKERQSTIELSERLNPWDKSINRIIGILGVAAVIGAASFGLSKESVRDALSRFNPQCIEDIDPDFHISCSLLNPESPATPTKPTFPRTIHEYYATSEALRTPHRVPLIPNSTPTPR